MLDGFTYSQYMRIRERFAGMALQGMLANPDAINRVWKKAKEVNNGDNDLALESTEDHLVERAVSIADKLCLELGKTEGGVRIPPPTPEPSDKLEMKRKGRP